MIKVSDLLDFYSTNSLSWEQLDYNNGKIKNLHYGLIHKGLPTMVDVAYDSLPYIKEEFMLKSFTLLKEGDVAFADASEDTNDVAKAIEVVNCNNQQIVSGLHTIHGRDNSNRTVIGYKGYAFASDSFHKQIRRITQGTKVFSISVRNFDEVYIGIPSKEEQTKIAKLLTAIDKRIATQNKIIERYESLIRGIVDAIILRKPQNAIIGDVCMISKQIRAESKIDDIITVRLHGNGVCKSNAESLQLGATQYYRRKAGQLIYGKQNFHNGAIGIIPKALDKGITSKDIPSFDIDNCKCNSTYLLAQLLSPKFYKPSEALTTGTGSKRLKEETFLKMPIVLPDKEEQDNIAVLIDKITMRLDQAKKMLYLFSAKKQYLLRQMFI